MYAEFETALANEIASDPAHFLTPNEHAERVLYDLNRDLCVDLWRQGVAITTDTIKDHLS